MSVTISDCSQICKSPLNNSTAKMLYSFPRYSRFSKGKTILCDKFYDVNKNRHFRTTNFGFGDKCDFTRNASCSPPPNTYVIGDDFKKNIQKGFGFGKGRDQMQVTGPFRSSRKDKNPGPGTYELPSTLKRNSSNFCPKLNASNKPANCAPGPGTYPATFTINQKGKYFLTNYKSSCVRDFGRYQGRCHTSQQKNPGPGSYTTQGVDLSPKGKYVSSKLQNCLVRSFVGPERKLLGQRTNTPGPGNYRLPSDFGYYQPIKKVRRNMEKLNNELVRNQTVDTEATKVQTADQQSIMKKDITQVK